jgi:hypothetical protein
VPEDLWRGWSRCCRREKLVNSLIAWNKSQVPKDSRPRGVLGGERGRRAGPPSPLTRLLSSIGFAPPLAGEWALSGERTPGAGRSPELQRVPRWAVSERSANCVIMSASGHRGLAG